MKLQPFQHVRLSSLRQCAVYPARLNFHGDFEIAINRVEMRWPVLSVIHRDNDSEEAADFGHAANFTLRSCCCLDRMALRSRKVACLRSTVDCAHGVRRATC